jgi:hypothetical protein
MNTVAGIFTSRADAESAVERLRSVGVGEDSVSLLIPGATQGELDEAVPTTETEQSGTGTALGGTVGGAIGAAGGLHLGAAIASFFVPGVGPIMAAGIIGAALLGAGGVATGMAAGGALEGNLAKGLPHDELFVYEDALRQGRSVLIVSAEDDEQVERVRAVLADAGAESLDAARESWWVGLRDAEEEEYTGQGSDFKTDEPHYRRGFEAALHPQARGRSYEEDAERLRECFGEDCEVKAFRSGYERGRRYHQSLAEKYKA